MDYFNRLFRLMKMEGNKGGAGGSGGDPETEPNTEPNNGGGDPTPPAFTQADIDAAVSNNTSEIYKTLGFENSEAAKAFVNKYKEEEEKGKSELTKAQERITALEKDNTAKAKEAQTAIYRLKAVQEGCNPNSAADIVLLASAKVTDKKDFDAALKEVKEAYPSMFDSEQDVNKGTGGSNSHRRTKGSVTTGIGKRLAEQHKNSEKKNIYFSN